MKMESKILGILGGGQLGRMSAMAAARLGISTHILCPEEGCPASLVTPFFTCADYKNEEALKAFAASVDVIGYEFENIPLKTIEFLKKLKPVYPDSKLLEVSQNRLKEKDFLNSIGIPTAPWAPCYKAEDIEVTLAKWATSKCIIKTARFGYDGKGQIFHRDNDNIHENWAKLNTEEAVIEGVIDFDFEISAIIARDLKGQSVVYPAALNEHKNHILSKTIAPAPIPTELHEKAAEMVTKIADAVDLVGVLTLELFVTKDGELLANEIAPRTHNSGHWTIDACAVSQFENHVRTVCGLPVGDATPHSAAEMINLVGIEDVKSIPKYLDMPHAHVHLYGKTEARDGRKMGHVTILKK
ncbi:MAG: 5-(carboxyamino)imidazole ribonucleotide synthase [Alphaproteobacteria bacterium]|nr:5-(carboxyamino)imidazole ribonucleotide synthase [Alphaproteobacteria bacterium]